MKYIALLLLMVSTHSAISESMGTQKSECESLMNELVPFAFSMLEKHGEFYPYGGKILLSGETQHAGASDGSEQPSSTELIKILKEGFSHQAADLKATAIIYRVRITPPDQKSLSDAIQVDLNHREGYSASVFFPYSIQDEKLKMGQIFASTCEFSPFKK